MPEIGSVPEDLEGSVGEPVRLEHNDKEKREEMRPEKYMGDWRTGDDPITGLSKDFDVE